MKPNDVFIFGYTRDSKGIVTNYHKKTIANTVHTLTGKGGNTDQFAVFVYETQCNMLKTSKLTTPPRLAGLNAEKDGTSQTVKANYYKVSASNFYRVKDWGATAVRVISETE